MTGGAPRLNFVQVFSDADVARNDHPIELTGQASHPVSVRRICSKLIREMDNLMLWREDLERASQTEGDCCRRRTSRRFGERLFEFDRVTDFVGVDLIPPRDDFLGAIRLYAPR